MTAESKRTAFKTGKDLSTSNRRHNFTQTPACGPCDLEQRFFWPKFPSILVGGSVQRFQSPFHGSPYKHFYYGQDYYKR